MGYHRCPYLKDCAYKQNGMDIKMALSHEEAQKLAKKLFFQAKIFKTNWSKIEELCHHYFNF